MSAYSDAIYTTVTPVIGGITVILNVIELVLIYKLQRQKRNKKAATKSFIYLVNLSVSDVIVGLVMIVLKSMDPFMKTDLKNDELATEFYSILKHVFIRLTMFISIFNLLALTFDRYLAITNPLQHMKRGKSFTFKVKISNYSRKANNNNIQRLLHSKAFLKSILNSFLIIKF